MKTIIVKPLTHRGADHFGLFFEYDEELISIAKSIGCTFSFQHTCWYLAQTKENLHRLFTVYKGKAWLDITAIKNEPKKPNVSTKKEKPIIPKARAADIEQLALWMRHKHYSEGTIKVYSDCVQVFFQHQSDKDPKSLTREDFIGFCKNHILDRGLSYTYQNQFVNALKLYLYKIHGVSVKTDFLERPRRESKLPNVLSKEEVQQILQNTNNPKHKLMLSVAYGCGLRAGEVLNLRPQDIDRVRRCMHIKLAKGFKDRVIPLPAVIENQLDNYLRKYAPKTWLFEGDTPGNPYTARSLQLVLKKAVHLSSINKPVTMHWLRHSYATHLMESGVDTRYIQVLLGHKNIKTTEIYTPVSTHKINQIASPLDNLNL